MSTGDDASARRRRRLRGETRRGTRGLRRDEDVSYDEYLPERLTEQPSGEIREPVQSDETGGDELGGDAHGAGHVLRDAGHLLELRADDDEERGEEESEGVAGHLRVESPRDEILAVSGDEDDAVRSGPYCRSPCSAWRAW